MSDTITSSDQAASSSISTDQSPLCFAFVGGPRDGQNVSINATKFSIGSSEKASFRLVCKGVHPIHCIVMRGKGGTVVKRTSKDTLINGSNFEEAPLENGDVLSIGPLKFKVTGLVAAAAAEQSAGGETEELNSRCDQLMGQLETLETGEKEIAAQDAPTDSNLSELERRLMELEAARERDRLELEAKQKEIESARAAAEEAQRALLQQQAAAQDEASVQYEESSQQFNEAFGEETYADVSPEDSASAAAAVASALGVSPETVDDEIDPYAVGAPEASRTHALEMLNQLRDATSGASTEDGVYGESSYVETSESDSFSSTEHVEHDSFEDSGAYAPEEASAVPQSTDELTFSEPTNEAPIDTASILAKLGHSIQDDEDDGTMLLDQREAQSVPPVDQTMPVSAYDSPPMEPASAEDGEGDESIDDYMAQLMARVGGGTYEQPSAQEDKKEEEQTAEPQVNVEQEKRPERSVPLDPSEFVPRAIAPEASSNLQALRAVANTSARSAIDRHQRRALDNKSYICWFLAIVSAIVCFSMAFFAEDIMSIPTLVSMISLLISFFATINALAYSAKAKIGARSTQKQLAASLTHEEN